MSDLSLVFGALGVLAAVVFLVIVPAKNSRAWALSAVLLVTTVVGNNSAPKSIWVPAFALCVVFLLISVGRTGLRRPALNRPLVIMVLWWGFLAVGAVANHSYSIPRMIAYFGTALAIAFVATQLTAAEVRIVLITVVVIAGLEAFVGLANVALNMKPMWGFRGHLVRTNPLFPGSVERAQGTMGQPIVFGMLMGIGAIIAWSNPIRMRRGLRLIVLALMLFGVVLSGTRSVLLSLAVALVVHLLMRARLSVWFRNALVALVVGFFVLVGDFGLGDKFDELIDSGSFIHRMGSIVAIPNLLAREGGLAVWGSGFGSETTLFQRHLISLTYGLKVVDDFFVYLLGTTGIVGLCLFLAITIWAFARADRTNKSVIAFLLMMCLSFDLLVWIYAGLILTMFYVLPSPSARDVDGSETLEEPASAGTKQLDGLAVR